MCRVDPLFKIKPNFSTCWQMGYKTKVSSMVNSIFRLFLTTCHCFKFKLHTLTWRVLNLNMLTLKFYIYPNWKPQTNVIEDFDVGTWKSEKQFVLCPDTNFWNVKNIRSKLLSWERHEIECKMVGKTSPCLIEISRSVAY